MTSRVFAFTDSHCHLDFREFDQHRENLLEQCHELGVCRFIVPGITAKRWPRVLGLCQRHPQALPCLGLHPWWIEDATDEHLWLLEQLAQEQPLVAIGEIGIDGAIDDIDKQSDYFSKQLQIAKNQHLPVVIHHRKSHHLIVPILKQAKLEYGGIIHAFSGNYQQAMTYIEMGFKLGIGGTITYDRAAKTRDAVSKIPLEAIVLETDAPAMPLQGFQGKDNSPTQLPRVFNELSKLRSEDHQQLAEQIENNITQVLSVSAKRKVSIS